MKKTLLILLGLVGFTQFVSAQVDQYQFEPSIHNLSVQQITQSLGSGNDFFRDMVTDQSGNVYVLAHYDVAFNASTTRIGNTGYLLKFSSTGQLIYRILIGTGISVNDIELDQTGYLYIAGGWWDKLNGSTVNLLGMGLTGVPSGFPYYQCSFVLKVDNNGQIIWGDPSTCGPYIDSVAGNNNHVYLANVKAGKDGIYVVGTTRYSWSFGNDSYNNPEVGTFFAKYSLTGAKLWSVGQTGYLGFIIIRQKNTFLALDSDDNSYFTVRVPSNAGSDFYVKGAMLPRGSGTNIALFSFDSAGNMRRYKYFAQTGTQDFFSVRVTKNNDLVIYGTNTSPNEFMNFSGGDIASGTFIVRLKNDGTYINHVMLTGGQYGSTALFSNVMSTDAKGNIYLMTTRGTGSFVFPNGQIYSSSGAPNYFIIKLDENFTTQYVVPFTGQLISNSFNHDLYIDESGYVSLGTSFRGFTNFLGSNLTSDASISGNHHDMFVVKIGIESCYGLSSFGFKNEVVGGFNTTTMCWKKNGFNTLKDVNDSDVNVETIASDQIYTVSIPFKNLTSIGFAQPKINFLGNWDVIAAAKGTGTLDIKIKVFNPENIKNLLR